MVRNDIMASKLVMRLAYGPLDILTSLREIPWFTWVALYFQRTSDHKGTFPNDHPHSGSLGTQRPKFNRATVTSAPATIGPFRTLSTLQYLRILVKFVKAYTMPLSTTTVSTRRKQ